MAKFHDRMPVYLGRDDVGVWVNDPQATDEILHRLQPQYVAPPAEPPKPQQISML